jgi:hypothetical protein
MTDELWSGRYLKVSGRGLIEALSGFCQPLYSSVIFASRWLRCRVISLTLTDVWEDRDASIFRIEIRELLFSRTTLGRYKQRTYCLSYSELLTYFILLGLNILLSTWLSNVCKYVLFKKKTSRASLDLFVGHIMPISIPEPSLGGGGGVPLFAAVGQTLNI